MPPVPCYCHVPDWRKLRLAMGLSERQFCSLLGISRWKLHRIEDDSQPHQCPHKSTLLLLHAWMAHPAYLDRLVRAGVQPPPEPELDFAG